MSLTPPEPAIEPLLHLVPEEESPGPGVADPVEADGADESSFEQRQASPDRRVRAMTAAPGRERRRGQRRSLVLGDSDDELDSVAFAVALRVTGNRQAAADITQEQFFALWRKPENRVPTRHGSIRARLADALEGNGRSSERRLPRETMGSDAEPRDENYEFAGWLPRGEPVTGPPAPDLPGTGLETAPGVERQPTVTVVIPTMNEAKNLPHVFERLPKWIDEVIIVDGHSTDDTVAVAISLRPDVKIVNQTGKGKGNALACGFKAATGDITVMLDADGSTDPAEIPRFVSALTNGFDFAKGSRFVTGGGSDDITRIRRIGNWGITTVVNRIWGVKYSDLCYGYNAFWTKQLPPSFSDCSGFEVETLMNLKLAASDLKVVEVPSFEANRQHGTSNLKAGRDGRRILRTILAEWLRPR